jgi:hypothetical protein
MSKTAIVSDEWLKQNLTLDEVRGLVYLNYSGKRGRNRGGPLGSLSKQGYLQTEIKGKQFKVHRLVWLLYYGDWPNGQIDHINKVKTDNRVTNLRAGNSVNQHNRDMPLPATGLQGCRKQRGRKNWNSSIVVKGEVRFLGVFDCPVAAHLTYIIEKDKATHG